MARYYPAVPGEFTRISGVGERKLAEYGSAFLDEIAAFLRTNPRQIFADDSFTAPPFRSRHCLLPSLGAHAPPRVVVGALADHTSLWTSPSQSG